MQRKKNIFNKLFKKTEEKMLNETETENNANHIRKNRNSLKSLLVQEKELTKNERIIRLLKNIGCKKDIFLKNYTFDYIQIKKMRKNINLLTSLNFSKFELSKIISQCDALLNIESETLEKNINKIVDYIKSKQIAKQIIYLNPYILLENANEKINNVREIFSSYNISIENQKYLLEENANILTLEENTLRTSLKLIKQLSKNNEEFIKNILNVPIIIGCQNKELIQETIV